MWVIDASVAVRWFLEDEKNVYADKVLARLVEEPTRFGVPELFCFEVYSVLCRVHPADRGFEAGSFPCSPGMHISPWQITCAKRQICAAALPIRCMLCALAKCWRKHG